MKNPFHNPKETTNVASQERKDTRQVRKDIRQADRQADRAMRDWAKDVRWGREKPRDGE